MEISNSNPQIGSQVYGFRGHGDVDMYSLFADGTHDEDVEMLTRAASNMKSLVRAHMFTGPLPSYIVTNLPLYFSLVELSIHDHYPSTIAWFQVTMPLRSLKWTIPAARVWGVPPKNPWASAQLLESMLQATTPELESLDVWFNSDSSQREIDSTPSPHAKQYLDLLRPSTTNLKKLKHFGMKIPPHDNIGDNQADFYLDFVSRHRNTLTSLALGKTETAYILQICSLVPKVKTLNLLQTLNSRMPDISILGPALSSPFYEIESFSFHDSGMTFGTRLASFFSSWKSLKCLLLGDHSLQSTQFGNDGRLEIAAYTDEIVKFFSSLPKTMEEVCLELNGEELLLDDDEDFDPICSIGGTLFASQNSLRSVDIHGWFSNLDGGLGSLPEKAVFYRRLAGVDSGQKEIWTSRMDSIYQEEETDVTVKKENLNGVFEGEDEKQPWLNGYENPANPEGGMWKGWPRNNTSNEWPVWKPIVREYQKFKKNVLD